MSDQCECDKFFGDRAEILNNEVDLGIVEGILKSKDLVITPVCEDEMVVVCGKSHWLATKERVTLEMLQGQPYISRESGSSERNQIEKMFEDHGVQLRRIFCSTNTEAIKKAVIRGRGIAVFQQNDRGGEAKRRDDCIAT